MGTCRCVDVGAPNVKNCHGDVRCNGGRGSVLSGEAPYRASGWRMPRQISEDGEAISGSPGWILAI